MLIEEATTTDALLKFVIEHKHPDTRCLDILRKCAIALRNSDKIEAVILYDQFHKSCGIGRMGCFDDVSLKPAYENEDINYVNELFRALLSRWVIRMNRLKGPTS